MKNPYVSLSASVLLLSFMTCFFACNKNKDSSYAPYNPIPVESQVVASLQGRILDENGSPVSGATVISGGGSTTTTDANGIFSFKKISLSSRFGYVKVTKTGYFTGSRSIITNAGALNYVNIQLVPRSLTNSFAASTGGSVIAQAGDTARFSGASVVTAATKVAYTGDVHVYAKYLDPTDEHFSGMMPGDLRGIGTDGKETPFQSFGMMAVELQGDGGEKLQLAAGQQSTITLAIPAALQAKAPASVPLWYFNDSSGRWIQEGSATREDNKYIGKVSHFTVWSAGLFYPAVNFKVTVKDQSGNPVGYTRIQFQPEPSDSYFGGTISLYTDSAGFAQGLIPSGVSLMMQVLSECGTLIGGANVGPALSDQDLGTLSVTLTYADITVSGKVVNCSNTPIDSGAVNIRVDGLTYGAVVKNGNFSLPITRCYNSSTQISVQAIDLVSLKQSSVVAVSGQSGPVDAGTISICSDSSNPLPPSGRYFTFTYKGVTATYTSDADTIDGGYTAYYSSPSVQLAVSGSRKNYVSPDGNGNNVDFILGDFNGTVGYYHIYYFSYIDPIKGYQLGGIGGHCYVTQYDSVGGYIIGNFGGDLLDQSPGAGSDDHQPITGAFKIIRTM